MRIVSLTPSNTELLFALGLGDQVVGVDDNSDYPSDVLRIPSVGTDLDVDIEKVVALHPDLVVASMASPGMEANVQKIRERGLNHIVLETERFTDILSDAYEVAVACDVRDRGEELVIRYNGILKDLASRVGEPTVRPRVYFELWPNPIYTPGALNWVTDMIHMAGGENIFRDFDGSMREVSQEEVAERDPEIILLCWASDTHEMTPDAIDTVTQRLTWKSIDAVKTGRIIPLPEALFARPGPRLIDGLELLMELMDSLY